MDRTTASAPSLEFETGLHRAGHARVAGVDEVGRGSWAGPIVAAAVVLRTELPVIAPLAGVRDSKQLTAAERRALLAPIREAASGIGIGWVHSRDLDHLGVARANRLALLRAVRALPFAPDALLLDHFALPECLLPQLPVTHGDALSLSIAAASIVAKVVRDRWMAGCDRRYPGYGFAAHKGYGTAGHREALSRLGPCPLHRRSFTPIAQLARCLDP